MRVRARAAVTAAEALLVAEAPVVIVEAATEGRLPSVEELARELTELRACCDILADNVTLLQDALLEVETLSEVKAIHAVVHRALGKPKDRG
jgi:hypothetical protein